MALADPERADVFDARDRTVLEYAAAMTTTPVNVPDALFTALREHLDPPQIVELTATIAWENYRARFNHALGMESEGFDEGAICAIPPRPAISAP